MKRISGFQKKHKEPEKWITVLRIAIVYLALRISTEKAVYYVYSENYALSKLMSLLFPISFINVLILSAICILMFQTSITKNTCNRLAALLFSIAMVVGDCYKQTGKFFGISKEGGFLLLISFYGFYIIFGILFYEAEKICHKLLVSNFTKIECLIKSHFYLKSFIGMYLCWLPYLIIRYPAGIEYDAYGQIVQGMGLGPLHAHHPVLSSIIMGKMVSLGKWMFGSYNAGAFLFVLFQATVCIAVLSYSLSVLYQMGVKPVVTFFCFMVYAIVPIYPGFLTAIVKDSLFSVFVLLDIVLLIQVVMGEGKRRKLRIAVGVTSLAVCMLRNNGIVIVFFLFLAFFIASFKNEKRPWEMTITLLLTIIGAIVYSNVLLPCLGIASDAMTESFSLPYQQTARYLKYYPEDISEDETAIIDRVLDAEYIAEKYNPLLSDPVKDTYHGTPNDLKEYFKLWFKMFFRHPSVYVGATLHNSYGFFYPDLEQQQALGLYMHVQNRGEIQFKQPEFLSPWREGLSQYGGFWEHCPLLYIFYNGGFHTWIVLWVFIVALVNKNKPLLLVSIPGIVTFLVCLASPGWWNNGFRYMLPVMIGNPILLSFTSICIKVKEEKER